MQNKLNSGAFPRPPRIPIKMRSGKIVFADECAFTFKTGDGSFNRFEAELRELNREGHILAVMGKECIAEIAQLPIGARVIPYQTNVENSSKVRDNSGGALSAGIIVSHSFGFSFPVLKNGVYVVQPALGFLYVPLNRFETRIPMGQIAAWDRKTEPMPLHPQGIITDCGLAIWEELVLK